MINARELRIGNWVEYLLEDEMTKWEETRVDGKDIELLEGDAKYRAKHRAILFTKDFLIRFGFKESSWEKSLYILPQNPAYAVDYINTGANAQYRIYHKGQFTGIEILHVHELQNFYALIHTELELKKRE